MASTSIKRTYLKLSDKVKVIDEVKNGAEVTQLAKKYGVSKATICKIKRYKSEILQRVSDTYGGPGNRRTLKNAQAPRMENRLYKWFLKQRYNHTPISGELIKERAKLLNKKLKETKNFVASDGWLRRFKMRYGIRLMQISGKKLSTSQLIQPCKEKLMNKIKELHLNEEQIYNADETSLYWKLLPAKTYVASHETFAPGRKPEKQRITFLACTNTSGTHKIRPLVIGKTKNPRSFRNFKSPVDYDYSKSASMTEGIFLEWFHKQFVPQVKSFLKKQKLPIKAVLILDNVPCHPSEEQLTSTDGSIFVIFRPPNLTPLIQPIHQNIIKITKLYYRKFLLLSVLTKNPKNISESLKQVTLREAILNLDMAWNALNQQTIKKYWKNMFYSSNDYDDKDIKKQLLSDAEVFDNASLDIVNLLKAINPDIVYTINDVSLWNDDKEMNDVHEEEDGVSEDDESSIEAKNAINDAQAAGIFNQALVWAEEKDILYSDILVLRKLRAKALENIDKRKFTQTKIRDYFS